MGAFVRCKLCHIGAEQLNPPRIRPQVAADLIEQRGLAGAIWADNQAALTRPYREGYALRYQKATERLLQVDDLKRTIRCRRGHGDPLRSPAATRLKPGTIPVGITRTMNRNTRPSSMFQRSI